MCSGTAVMSSAPCKNQPTPCPPLRSPRFVSAPPLNAEKPLLLESGDMGPDVCTRLALRVTPPSCSAGSLNATLGCDEVRASPPVGEMVPSPAVTVAVGWASVKGGLPSGRGVSSRTGEWRGWNVYPLCFATPLCASERDPRLLRCGACCCVCCGACARLGTGEASASPAGMGLSSSAGTGTVARVAPWGSVVGGIRPGWALCCCWLHVGVCSAPAVLAWCADPPS